MENLSYESAVYKINHKKETLSRVPMKGHKYKVLPKELAMKDMIDLLVSMQKVCFQDENVENENADRMKNTFLMKNDKTVAVILSLGYGSKKDSYTDYVDGASATLQKSNLEFLPYQQPIINEVCRHKVQKLDSLGSPTNNIMELIESYVVGPLMKSSKRIDGLYLYVEKKPKHGCGKFLLEYYGKKYGFEELKENEDEDYYYMKKHLERKTPPKRTLKKSKSPSSKGGTRKVHFKI